MVSTTSQHHNSKQLNNSDYDYMKTVTTIQNIDSTISRFRTSIQQENKQYLDSEHRFNSITNSISIQNIDSTVSRFRTSIQQYNKQYLDSEHRFNSITVFDSEQRFSSTTVSRFRTSIIHQEQYPDPRHRLCSDISFSTTPLLTEPNINLVTFTSDILNKY